MRPHDPKKRLPGGGRRWKSPWRFYTLLGVGLLGLFLYALLIRPAKTPVLMLTGIAYQAPVPPNAWAFEDHLALTELSETLSVDAITGSWIGVESDARAQFRSRLADHQALRRGFRAIREPVVIYISMPGVVNESGQACLLPPGASPWISDDWLKLETLVREIAEAIPDERCKLIVLDSNQEVVNWDLGIVYNTFTERVKQTIHECGVPNLALLASADEGEMRWASPQLGGSVFGQFLRLGLAGAADLDGDRPDGDVDLQELVRYVTAQVDGWARSNRGSRQRPVLATSAVTSAANRDFVVTHALSEADLAPYQAAISEARAAQPSVSREKIAKLWSMLDGLRELDVPHYDPVGFGVQQRRLLRLEQLAYGGSAYAEAAKGEEVAIKDAMQTSLEREKTSSHALADHWGVANSDAAASIAIAQPLSSLPLCEYFGQVDLSLSGRIKALWRQLAAPIRPTDIRTTPTPADESSLIRTALRFVETQLLVAVHRQTSSPSGGAITELNEALDLLERGENAAVPRDARGLPSDERAHYFVRLALDAADRQRLLAEDELFAPSSSPGKENASRSKADILYDLAETIRDRTTKSLATSDLAWSETIDLAKWRCRIGGDREVVLTPEKISELLSLVRQNHALGKAMAAVGELPSNPERLAEVANQFDLMATSLQRSHAKIREEFQNLCKALGDGAAENGAEMLAFEGALASPLIDAALRSRLLQLRDELAVNLHKDHFSAAKSAPIAIAASRQPGASELAAENTDVDASSQVAATMAKWDQSPLVAILVETPQAGRVHATGAELLQRLEGECWTVRKQLRALARLPFQGADAAENSTGVAAHFRERQVIWRAERQFRAAAPLGLGTPQVDAIVHLRRFDLQQLLLWHAKRALDGFWHSDAGPDPKTAYELIAAPVAIDSLAAPYFAETAESYLRAAELVYAPLPPGVGVQVNALRQLSARRLAASQHGLRLDAKSAPLLDARTDIRVELQVQRNEKGPDLPSGLAAIYLSRGSSERVEVVPADGRWGSVAVPIAQGTTETMSARAANVTSAELDAVVFFRGRRFRREFGVNSLGGAVVEYEFPVYDRQSVTLYGDQPTPPSVVFILDCSGSMEAKIEAEVAGTFKPRMEVAVAALKTMLDELARRRGTSTPRVGVWFFGHRVAWAPGVAPPKIDFKPVPPNVPLPRDLAPAEDVERVLPLGAFRAQELGLVTERLQGVQYHGLTPVNLAILKAIAEFDYDDDNFSKSIIVITDGVNDQRHPTGAGFKSVKTTTPAAVLSAWDRTGKAIPVFIVGFGIPKNDQTAEAEFKTIADHTGGAWLPTDSGGDLIDFLRKRLDVNGYLVFGPNGRSVVRDPVSGEPKRVELNTEVDVSADDFHLPVELDVTFQSISKPVTLEGGEKLELQVNRDGDDIVLVPYDVDVAERAELVRGAAATPTDRLLRVHRPKRSGDRVNFRFSVQDQEIHFTRRPKEVWIEVSPDGAKESYLFYDAVYEPLTPTPVARFTVANWPPDADYARVKFWCNDQLTPSIQSIPLAHMRDADQANAPFQAVRDVPGVEIRVRLATDGAPADDGFQVLVEERYVDSSAHAGSIRVWIDVADPSLRPRSVSHLFDARNNVARRRFSFPSQVPLQEFVEKTTVRLAKGETIKQNAQRLEDPRGLRVRIVNDGATHVPSAVQPVP